MGSRDERLGPYGIYSREKTEEVGLRKALLDTVKHLEAFLSKPKITDSQRLVIKDEIGRIRGRL